MAFREIPVVSLSDWTERGAGQQAFADRLRAICHEVGFFQLVDHGVDPAFVEEYFTALPVLLHPPGLDQGADRQGAVTVVPGLGAGRLRAHRPQRRLSRADRRLDRAPAAARDVEPPYLRLDGPNQWPDDATVPGFRRVVERFQSEMGAIADQLMAAMCVGLGLAPDHLDKLFGERRSSLVKLIHYPPTPPGEAGVNAHHDAGFLTLLWQHGVAGLQVLNEDGEWIDVPASNDAIVVNLGEILQSMTGNYFVATTHRVIAGRGALLVGLLPRADLRTVLDPLPLDHRFTDAVAASPRHRDAGFMAKHDELLGGERGTRSTSAACYGEQLWNYFARSYPDLVRRHHPDVATSYV